MSKTPAVIANEIIAKLGITAPGFSLELGTPERKIIDAVAESISEAYVDQYLIGSLLDIESKAGIELEQFLAIFGFGRLQGRQASGVVRIELNTANPQDVTIPVGSQFYTRQNAPSTGTPLYFNSTQAVLIPAGTLITDVPVECVMAGVIGNVPPDSIVFLGQVLGASSVTNLQSFTGGVDIETDDELRQRFKDTFMRNVAGTTDWYLGLAYQNKNISKAACYGPIHKYFTQIVVPSSGGTLNLSSGGYIPSDVKYAWPGVSHVSVFKNLGQEDEKFYRMYDDFEWTHGTSPQLKNVASGDLEAGDVVDVEFEYTPKASRNDPETGITNKVDLYVNGSDPYTITERTVVTSQTLSSTPGAELYVGNFARVGASGTPSSSNRFMRLGSVPIISFPSSITIGSTNYQQVIGAGVGHYYLLRGTTIERGSIREVAGIEWTSGGPSNDTPVTVNYVYNRVPEVMQAIAKANKQITTDILVHQASYQYMKVCLSIEFDRGYVISQVTNAIQDRLKTYFNGLPYGAWVEISDLCLAVHQVLGVDNVNLTTSDENNVDYGIKVYGNSSDALPSSTKTGDFKLTDDQLPIFMNAVILRKPNR